MARVLITGANRGIGLAFARAFGERDDAVARLLPLIDRIDAWMSGTFIDVRGRTIPG